MRQTGVLLALPIPELETLSEWDCVLSLRMLRACRHYKYPPADIPTKLIQGGADIEAKDSKGMTALQVSLLAGW